MHDDTLKIGELARRSGVSVRTLHHYDAIGLLAPAVGGAGSQRLYGPAEVARLQHIRTLQGLGLTLEEIGRALDDPAFDPLALVERQRARLVEEIDLATRLAERLDAVALALRASNAPRIDDLLESLELMNRIDWTRHYTPEQLETLAARRREVGEERMRTVQEEWRALFAAFRDARERGAAPDSPEVAALARRSLELVAEFTGGDPGLHASLASVYRENPELPERLGADTGLWAYMGEAQRRASAVPEEVDEGGDRADA